MVLLEELTATLPVSGVSTVMPPSMVASDTFFCTFSTNAAATCVLPSEVCACWRLDTWLVKPPADRLPAPVAPAVLIPPEIALSACLSASDFSPDPFESPSPSALAPGVEVEPVEELAVAPCAPAREVDFMELRLTALTRTLPAFTLLRRLALALSLTTEIAKEPPTPTLPPAAAALAVISRNIALWAETTASPAAFRTALLLDRPSLASVLTPLISRPKTGVAEMPPEEPAVVFIVSVPE